MATTTNINVQDLFKTYVGNSKDNVPHDEGQRKFEKKHITDKKVLFDPKLGAKNDQFQADNVKVINREKMSHGPNSYRQTGASMGYNQGDNEQKVYAEEAEGRDKTSNAYRDTFGPGGTVQQKQAAKNWLTPDDTGSEAKARTPEQHKKRHAEILSVGSHKNATIAHLGKLAAHSYKVYHDMKEEVELDEKHLTPAEMKKREEIAKAMERKNPNMPMGKKMAIATATAKKVAEEAMHGPSCTCSACMTKRGKRMTKEDVINSAVARFMPEDFTPPTLEEKFTRAIDGLSEQMALTLVGLYESLNTDNKEEMVALMSTKEGMNKLIDFAINNKGE
jgi:hypothetical protein